MTATTLVGLDQRVTLSPEQIAHYHEHGWVRVNEVIPRDVALLLRDKFLALSAAEKKQEAEALDLEKQNYTSNPEYRKQHVIHRENTLTEEFRQVIQSRRCGSIASQLLDAPQVQIFRTSLFEKFPEASGGGITTAHQDYPYIPVDRSGSLTIWIALADLPAETGTMGFASGSHRMGNLGRDRTFDDGSGYDNVQESIRRHGWTFSDPPSLKAGDATVHHDLTVHIAGANRSAQSRLALGTIYMDARARFTAAPNPLTDGLGLKLNHRFDVERFPLAAV